MNLEKIKRARKEAEVKYINDNSVNKTKIINELRSDKNRIKLLKDAEVKSTPKRNKPDSNTKKKEKNKSDYEESDKSFSENEDEIKVAKPLALFQDGDVPGKAVFGFQTPKRKNAMVDKATESAEKLTPKHSLLIQSNRTPSSVRKSVNLTAGSKLRSLSLKLNHEITPECVTPKNKRKPINVKDGKTDSIKKQKTVNKEEKIVPKTPYSLRARLKNKIAAQVNREFEDFSDSEDEFIPSDLEDEEEDIDSDENSDSDSKTSVDRFKAIPEVIKQIDNDKLNKVTTINTPLTRRKRKDLTYAITVDEYFNSNSGKKNKTSSHTLNKLKNPKLGQEQLDKLLQDFNRKNNHHSVLESLNKECCLDGLFKKWCFCLKEGYSILLYGLGSKRSILNTFQEKILSKSHVFVINGFFPGLTLKEIIDSLAGELLNIRDIPSHLHEVIEAIEAKLETRGSPRIFIIVHNLDGITLRTEKAQTLLARLASIPKCNLLASIDHINAPLLWDDKKLSEFNFIWEDVTTYNMYSQETSFENSLLVQRSGFLAFASLKNVFQSLTKNGKDIFKILVEDSLANKKNSKYSGIGFSDLYWKCRENFLVSTDLALRSQLTEFLDHQLVKWRKDSDHLVIPIDSVVLEQFQNFLNESNI